MQIKTKTRMLVAVLMAVTISAVVAAPRRNHGQQGETKITCNADHIYIYQYPDTNSTRRGVMGRGVPFRVYHYPDGVWAFGVHNNSRVAGYVLREKLRYP